VLAAQICGEVGGRWSSRCR